MRRPQRPLVGAGRHRDGEVEQRLRAQRDEHVRLLHHRAAVPFHAEAVLRAGRPTQVPLALGDDRRAARERGTRGGGRGRDHADAQATLIVRRRPPGQRLAVPRPIRRHLEAQAALGCRHACVVYGRRRRCRLGRAVGGAVTGAGDDARQRHGKHEHRQRDVWTCLHDTVSLPAFEGRQPGNRPGRCPQCSASVRPP